MPASDREQRSMLLIMRQIVRRAIADFGVAARTAWNCSDRDNGPNGSLRFRRFTDMPIEAFVQFVAVGASA